MTNPQRIDQLRTAARYAAASGAPDLATELHDQADALEQAADRRPGDFADDGLGDCSLLPGFAS